MSVLKSHNTNLLQQFWKIDLQMHTVYILYAFQYFFPTSFTYDQMLCDLDITEWFEGIPLTIEGKNRYYLYVGIIIHSPIENKICVSIVYSLCTKCGVNPDNEKFQVIYRKLNYKT